MRRGIKSQSKRFPEIFIHFESPFFREGHVAEEEEEGQFLKGTIFYPCLAGTPAEVLG